MADKIRVVHHSKTIGYAGTDRVAQMFCKHLLERGKYDPYLVYRNGDSMDRLDAMRDMLGEDHVLVYDWEPGKTGRQSPFMPKRDNLKEVLDSIQPDIFHIHRSGYAEWPGFKYLAPRARIVETNIFGYPDESATTQVDLNIYISEFIRQRTLAAGGVDGPVLYNPVEQPFLPVNGESRAECRAALLQEFRLPDDAIIMGRVGRADNFDPIALRGLNEALRENPNLYYIVVNPCGRWHEFTNNLGLTHNVRFSGPIIDDEKLSRFYMGLDIYAHARHDGECCPCNIQEAMMHGIPTISHEAFPYNGQSEILSGCGFVVPIADHEGYGRVLTQLAQDPEVRGHYGHEGRRKAMREYEAGCIASKLEQIYDWVLENR